MKVRIVIEATIDQNEYYDTYENYYDTLEKTKLLKDMRTDMIANAQYGVQQWADRLSFKTLKIKDKIWS